MYFCAQSELSKSLTRSGDSSQVRPNAQPIATAHADVSTKPEIIDMRSHSAPLAKPEAGSENLGDPDLPIRQRLDPECASCRRNCVPGPAHRHLAAAPAAANTKTTVTGEHFKGRRQCSPARGSLVAWRRARSAVRAVSARSSASSRAVTYRWVVASWEWPARCMTVARSAPPAMSQLMLEARRS